MTFEDFFREVQGIAPFPWQTVAAHLLAQRRTPRVTVPTGLGKSAMVDAAVWAAAQGGWRRIAFVVDRRIVVDAVHERAQRIAQALAAPGRSPAMAALAARLGPEALQVVRLRGGVHGDDDWVLHPERITVALTTVDQLGSRLLFRGYGVSPRRWPMHAGFFGHDTLVIVDEAHLSAPFLQTLHTLSTQGAGLGVVPMSATLGGHAAPQGGPEAHDLGEEERSPVLALSSADLALPVVQQRLAACKPASLMEAGPGEGDFVRALAAQAVALAEGAGVNRIGIVVNRVATARACFERLHAQGLQAVLLTGRVRAADRDRELMGLLPRIAAGRVRNAADTPLFVVATQTVEVGADLDFDALVTECASLSALRQRFGRLDRLGLRQASHATIVRRLSRERADPVYGDALAAAWDWLQTTAAGQGGTVDFGLLALQQVLERHPPPAEAVPRAATLLPAHLGLLAQTGPFAPALDLAAWLHGPCDRAPDVSLVWRDDLDSADPAGWAAAVGLLPPLQREALALPVGAVRRWLAQARADDDWGDLDASADDNAPPGPTAHGGRQALRWRGPDDCALVSAAEVRPGDTLVVPAAWGGCDRHGWAPQSATPVEDLADACMAARLDTDARARVVLRLTPSRWPSFGKSAGEVEAACAALTALQAQAAESEEDLREALAETRSHLLETVARSGHPLAAQLRSARLEAHPCGWVVRGRGTEELEGVIETGRAVTLEQHHADVGRWASALAEGEPAAGREAVVTAAWIHDAGKVEARMQALLHGSPLAAASGPVLAKSALRRRDEQLAAWRTSGVPKGFRHEFASLEEAQPGDPLVRHLTATHHGYGRPWLPPCADPEAPGARYAHLSSGWLAAWAAVHQGRSPWALAWMETLLRAAVARASMEEAAGDG
jgi:CRISPR-associated endonuclease/helicase Cas3